MTDPGADLSGYLSDDFNACAPEGHWTFSDPLGHSSHRIVGAGTGEAWLEIAIPAGIANNPWNNYNAPRLMQPIANADFEIEVKFLSAVTLRHQMQGLFIEQDAANYLRFDVHHDGSTMRIFASSMTNGVSQARYNVPIAAGTPLYMRVKRQGAEWTQSYSYDGTNWIAAAAFSRTLTTTKAGVFAGTAGDNPAHTVRADYIFNTAAPIVPEDAGAVDSFTLTVGVSGSGAVQRNPNQATYTCGSSVTLTAVPASGWAFSGWSGDLSGNQNPVTLTLNAARSVQATFSAATPPAISNVQASTTHNSATVTWTTDSPATSVVEYGPTGAYENGNVANSSLVTAHAIALTGLAAGQVYHFRVSSANDGGTSASADFTFVTEAGPSDPSGFMSDDFRACTLDGEWTFSDPLGLSSHRIVGSGTADSWLEISVPAGVANNPWNNYNAPRVMQPVANVDFEIEVKFLSALTLGYQIQGIFIEQDASNYLRFDFHHTGSGMQIFAASTTNGASQTRYSAAIATGAPLFMRVRRVGNQWTQSYSYNGTTWTAAAAFSRTLTAVRAGVFGGNAGSNPAHVARFDYAFSTATPVVPEDVPSPQAFTLSVGAAGSGTVQRNPSQGTYPCGTTVTLTAVPAAGWAFTGWSGDLTGTQNPATVSMTRDKAITAQFAANVPPQVFNLLVVPGDTWARVSWQTNEPATTTVPYGLTTSYGAGTYTDSALVLQHSALITGLAPSTGYHAQAISQDAAGASTASADLGFTTTSVSPLQISDIAAAPGDNSAIITWVTNKPASSTVRYGRTLSYELGTVSSATLTFNHSLTLPGLSTGTLYHYEVVSTDGASQTVSSGDRTFTTTAQFPVIDVWYGSDQQFGNVGIPQRWINILGNASDPNGIASLRYSLNSGTWRTLSMGPDSRRLASPGDFNVELDYSAVLQGTNDVRISATDTQGHESVKTVWFDVTKSSTWPTPYSVNWGSVSDIQDVAQVVDGLWDITGNTVRPLVLDYDRLIAIGDVTWANYEVTTTVKVQSIDSGGYASPSNGPAVGLGMRWKGHSVNGKQPNSDFWPAGAFGWYRWNASGVQRFELRGNRYNKNAYDNSGRQLALGQTYVFKMRVETEPDGQHLYRFKVWLQSASEPSGWDLQIRNGNLADDPTHGSLLLIAHHVDARFGSVVITPVP
jgi:uncharacterized repeat protein (TIGR02543 family)